MSDGDQPQPTGAPVTPWHPALRALLVLVGLILLLPGFCTLFFVYSALAGRGRANSDIVVLWIVCIGISVGGLLLIRAAARHRSP
jgi:hypothetical protein